MLGNKPGWWESHRKDSMSQYIFYILKMKRILIWLNYLNRTITFPSPNNLWRKTKYKLFYIVKLYMLLIPYYHNSKEIVYLKIIINLYFSNCWTNLCWIRNNQKHRNNHCIHWIDHHGIQLLLHLFHPYIPQLMMDPSSKFLLRPTSISKPRWSIPDKLHDSHLISVQSLSQTHFQSNILVN